MAISKELAKAIDNYIKRKASDADKEKIDIWHHSFDDTELIVDSDEIDRESNVDNAIRSRLSKTTGVDLYNGSLAGKSKSMVFAKMAVAASLIIAVTLISLWVIDGRNKKMEFAGIKPGRNFAILTLASGKKIVLSDSGNKQLANESGVSITKTNAGQLIYTVERDESSDGKVNNKILVNTIETPNGGKYQVNLPDGTKVWLNAASYLRYPSKFIGNKRIVELRGEAYFEVMHDKNAPFRVITDKQTVEVLGTHFNINSYPEEGVIKTTLLEGSVKVYEHRSGKSKLIFPGQQTVLKADTLKVRDADLTIDMAWKNGEFVFTHNDFRSEMRQVARWYNLEIEFDDAVPSEIKLGGFISREKSISAMMRLIESTGKVHFKVDGRRVLVTR